MKYAATRCYKRFYDLPLGSHAALHPSVHLSGHETTVYVTLQAKNRANLWTTQIIAVAIDTSPPVAGVVLDARPNEPDLDFVQAGGTLYASFEGFHDPESGIRHYLYAVGTSCQTSVEAFLAGKPSKRIGSTVAGTIDYITYKQVPLRVPSLR